MKKMILALALVAVVGAPALAKHNASAAVAAKPAAAPSAQTVKVAEDSLSRQLARIYGASINKMYSERKGAASKDKFKEGFLTVMQHDSTENDFLDGLSFGLEVLRNKMQMKQRQKIDLNTKEFAAQLFKSLADTTIMTEEQLRSLNEKVTQQMASTEQLARESDPQAAANLKAGADYVAHLLKTDKEFHRTASGLLYKIVTPGKGETYKDGATVKIKYKGMHVDGKVFDQNPDGAEMNISHTVPGFKEALMLMSPGCKLTAVIPGALGYGIRGAGNGEIGPNETLIFEIETPEPAKVEAAAQPAATAKKVAPAKATTKKAPARKRK